MTDNAEKAADQAYVNHLTALGHVGLPDVVVAGLDAWYAAALPADKNATILDFGCGQGDFLEYLIGRGYDEVSGCDINEQLVAMTKQRVSRDAMLIGDLTDFAKAHAGRFDCITMKDVLEHIPKEEAVNTLSALRQMLKDDGRVIVSCPQMCGFSSLFTLFDDYTHITLFTESSMRYVLDSAGYSRHEFIVPRHRPSWKPTTLAFRLLRALWFRIVKFIYYLERPGERMPRIAGDRIAVVAFK